MGLMLPPPLFEGYESNLTNPAATIGTSVAASATPHAKNTTYTTLIASTSFDAYMIDILFADVAASTVATDILVDIAIGAAASETVIIPNLLAGYAALSTDFAGQRYRFPLYIPAGSRISATAQALVVSDTVNVAIWLHGQPRTTGWWAGQSVTAYGITSASSRGTSVAAGVSAAEGTWTQIVASTTDNHYALCAGVSGGADTTLVAGMNHLDIGVGAATESPIAENLLFMSTVAENMAMAFPFTVYRAVPSGARLAARISDSAGGAQSWDVALYGVS